MRRYNNDSAFIKVFIPILIIILLLFDFTYLAGIIALSTAITIVLLSI